MSQLAYHLYVILHTLLEPLGFKRFANLQEVIHTLGQIILNGADGPFLALLGGHEQIGRIDAVKVILLNALTGKHIKFLNGINLVIPELDADCGVIIGQVYVNVLAFYAETASCQLYVISGVERVNQFAQQFVAVYAVSFAQFYDVVVEIGRVSHAVDA